MSAYKSWLNTLATGTDPIDTVDQDGGEKASAVVCRLAPSGAPLLFPDNLVAQCTKCFRMVQFRPHAPKTPPKMCDECIKPELEAQRASGEGVSFIITENTAADLARLKGTRH